jgi:hypothetical protein
MLLALNKRSRDTKIYSKIQLLVDYTFYKLLTSLFCIWKLRHLIWNLAALHVFKIEQKMCRYSPQKPVTVFLHLIFIPQSLFLSCKQSICTVICINVALNYHFVCKGVLCIMEDLVLKDKYYKSKRCKSLVQDLIRNLKAESVGTGWSKYLRGIAV